MIDHMNDDHSRHIVTIEDPIEFLHRDKRSILNQREVGQDTHSFKRALRRVLRQDPDVILIGEMRDEETVHTALSAAETGHLVLSTVHTVDAPETINRIIDFFPPHMHQQVRAMLAGTLKGVVSQRLVRANDGGRVATCEILRMTGRVRDMIMDPEQTGRLHRGHRRRRATTGCRRSTRRCSTTSRPAASASTRPSARRRARTTSSCCSPPTAAAARRWTTWATRSQRASAGAERLDLLAGLSSATHGPAAHVDDLPVRAQERRLLPPRRRAAARVLVRVVALARRDVAAPAAAASRACPRTRAPEPSYA